MITSYILLIVIWIVLAHILYLLDCFDEKEKALKKWVEGVFYSYSASFFILIALWLAWAFLSGIWGWMISLDIQFNWDKISYYSIWTIIISVIIIAILFENYWIAKIVDKKYRKK